MWGRHSRHTAYPTANCWHFVTVVIKRKSMSSHTFIERSSMPSPTGGMQWKCTMICKLLYVATVVACRVGEHQHWLAHRCSLYQNAHTAWSVKLWGQENGDIYGLMAGGAYMAYWVGHIWLKWVGHMWFIGWGICGLLGGTYMAYWVGHIWLKWVEHIWLKWVGELWQSKLLGKCLDDPFGYIPDISITTMQPRNSPELDM